MPIGLPWYSPTSTTRSQTLPNGSGAQTDHTITTRGRVLTTAQGAPLSSIAATTAPNTAITWTFSKVDGVTGAVTQFAAATMGSGSTTCDIGISSEQRFELNDVIRAQAPIGTFFPQASTITATWRYFNAAYIDVPQARDKIFVPSGGQWKSVREVWGARVNPINPTELEWKRIWIFLPNGQPVTLSQSGEPVDVSWENTANVDGLGYQIVWNSIDANNVIQSGSESGSVNGSNLFQFVTISGAFSNGDVITARMRYTSGTLQGELGQSDTLTYSGLPDDL